MGVAVNKQITRNAEEQEAFEALAEACLGSAPATFKESARSMAAGIERELLARGWVLTKIEEIKSLREVVDEYNEEHRKSSSLGFFD